MLSWTRTAALGGHVAASRAARAYAKLLRAERVVLEQRELPTVEGLREMRVSVGEAQPRMQLGRERPAESSSLIGSPGGAVAAIGNTGRMP